MTHTIVVGGSIAGLTVVKTLRQQGYSGGLTLLEPDLHTPYRRPGASKSLVTGESDITDLQLPWSEDWGCDRLLGGRAVALDATEQSISYELEGITSALRYDNLVLATGAQPRTPRDGGGVLTIRSVRDGLEVSERARDATDAVIVGAGFLGLEVAASLRKRGLGVTVVEAAAELFGGRFGPDLSEAVRELHAEHGVQILRGRTVAEILGDEENAHGIRLSDGQILTAGIVVWATGARPTVDWIGGALGDVSDGVVCNEFGCVSGTPGVYAVGDMARWYHPRYAARLRIEHWTNAIDQGRVVAGHIVDPGAAPALDAVPFVWSDQYERTFQVLGLPAMGETRTVLQSDPETLIVGYLRAGNLVGVAGLARAGSKIMSYRRQVAAESRVTEPLQPVT